MSQTVRALDRELEDWVGNLPENVRHAAGDKKNSKMLALCLIAFFMYYSAIIDLRMCTPRFSRLGPGFCLCTRCDLQIVRSFPTPTHQPTIYRPLRGA